MKKDKIYSRDKLLYMMDQNNTEVDELMSIFVRIVPPMLNEMLNCTNQGDWQPISDNAHKLKSSMRLWAIDSLEDIVVFIETYAAQETRLDEVKEKTVYLCKHLTAVIEDMKLELA